MLHSIIRKLRRLIGLRSSEPSVLLPDILGFKPGNMELYELAFTHSSCSKIDAEGNRLNNERLEFLGDSVLATAMSHYLYLDHPDWDEGNLSKRRGALVKRAVNNAVSKRMGLMDLLKIKSETGQISPDVYGNTLEALIGAIFLDKGYLLAEHFVVMKVLPLFKELEQNLLEQTTNYKSRLLEWAQKNHIDLEFRMLQEPKKMGSNFMAGIYLDSRRISIGTGTNKKEAHQAAAHAALQALAKADKDLAKEFLSE